MCESRPDEGRREVELCGAPRPAGARQPDPNVVRAILNLRKKALNLLEIGEKPTVE
jgi:hypothetical protein